MHSPVSRHLFTIFYQDQNMKLEQYHELLQAQVEVLDKVGITIEDKSLVVSIATKNDREVPNEMD